MFASHRSVLREIGTAFAVLAIYLLTVLAPLHEAAASQREFSALGFETIGAWSVCTAINEADSQGKLAAAINCPVTGVGKVDVSAAAGPFAVEPVLFAVRPVFFTPETRAPPRRLADHGARPRAPPVAV